MKFNKTSFRKDLVMKRAVELSLSVEDAAKQIGITHDELVGLEAGHTPTVDQFCAVCTWLKSSRPGKYFTADKEPEVISQSEDIQDKVDRLNDIVDDETDAEQAQKALGK